jgi:hypothetical protein
MRKVRVLLLLAIAAGIAAVAVPNAKALGYEDEPCPPQPQLKVCHPDAEVGKPYTLGIQGKGGCTPDSVVYSIVGGALPPGLSVSSSNAQVSGVPTTPGVYQFWLQVADIPQWQGGAFWCQDDKQSQWQFQITVVEGLQIQQRQSTLPGAQLNQGYNMQFTSNTSGVTWSVASGALPAGLNLNPSTGLLSGTPTAVGDYNFQIKAVSGSRSDTQSYTLSVVEPLRIAKAAAPKAEVGFPFEVALQASGGRGPYTWSATGLPAGLTLDVANGTISGTPTAATAASVKVTVTDTVGTATSVTLDLPVADRLSVKRGALPSAKVGGVYSFRLTTVGGAGPFKWSVASGLPVGIKLNAKTGRLYGVARKAGTYRFRVLVSDALGARSSRSFVLKVTGGSARR